MIAALMAMTEVSSVEESLATTPSRLAKIAASALATEMEPLGV